MTSENVAKSRVTSSFPVYRSCTETSIKIKSPLPKLEQEDKTTSSRKKSQEAWNVCSIELVGTNFETVQNPTSSYSMHPIDA